MERRNELPLAARITGSEHSRIEQGVGHVAASAARNPHLGKKLRAPLEKRNPAALIGARGSNRGKKTGGTATCNHDFSHSLTYTESPTIRKRDELATKVEDSAEDGMISDIAGIRTDIIPAPGGVFESFFVDARSTCDEPLASSPVSPAMTMRVRDLSRPSNRDATV